MEYISLDKNENRYPHAQNVIDYLKNISTDTISYYSSSVDPLVHSLSNIYAVPVEQILLAHGGEALLKESIGSIVSNGDIVLLPEGGWAFYTKLVLDTGGEPEFFKLGKNNVEYYYSAESIQDLILQKRPKLLVLASPNNPTGHVIGKSDLLKILNAAEQTQTFIILDEAYFGFSIPDYCWEDIKNFPKLLIIRTFSKLFGLAGLRIGFAFCTSGWQKLTQELYRYLGFSHLSSDIALQVLNSIEYYQENAKKIVMEREKLEQFFLSLKGFVYKSHANFVTFELPEEIFYKAKKIFETTNIKIKFFSAEKEPWFKNHIRITVGLPDENEKVRKYFQQII